MAKYPFLSDEWVSEAHRIYAEVSSSGGLGDQNLAPVRVNLIITEAPFSERPIDAHVDTSSGRVEISTGHVPAPDVTISMGYGTARSLFVAGDVQAVMQAFLGGRIRVDGDLSKLLDPRSGIWPGSAPGAPGAGGGPGGSVAAPSTGSGPATSGNLSGGLGGPFTQAGTAFPGAEAAALAARLMEITE
jgi:hypothetical protein